MLPDGFPGSDLVRQGLEDIGRGLFSEAALLVAIGAPRLRSLGVEVPECEIDSPEHRLYNKLWQEDPDSAHSRYNALLRRLVSFERAMECAS
jgi:hypothetical protein